MIAQATTESLYTQIATAFENLSVQDSSFVQGLRKQAFERFIQAGFPTVKHEDWKYSNIQRLVNRKYALGLTESAENGSSHRLADIPNLDAYHIVFENGVYREDLSDELAIEGVQVKSIVAAREEELFIAHFSQYADKTENPFVALNTALFVSGVFISVAPNYVVDKPIHIIHQISADQSLFTINRNLFVLGAHAEAEIVESFVGTTAADTLNNHVSEIVLAEQAKLQHYYLQEGVSSAAYINHIEVYQKKHSLYNNYNCTFPGASFVRNDINVRLDDQQVESHLYGITLTADEQHVDNHTIVDHLQPHCESYEWYKNITQDASTAVFNGKIFVREDAQKTNAFQQNNNILLGDDASVYTKPQLEIFADDVKCSHGCTIGQFDNDALFYLRARGIGEEQARILLIHAFAFDVTSRFSNDTIRQYVESRVAKGLEKK